MDNPITIMLVDDHEVVRRGVRFFLESQPGFSVVAEADSGEAAIPLAEKHIPDVVLIDLIMPKMGGVEATRQIKNVSPRTQIIVLTSYHDDEHNDDDESLELTARVYVNRTHTIEDDGSLSYKDTSWGVQGTNPQGVSLVLRLIP